MTEETEARIGRNVMLAVALIITCATVTAIKRHFGADVLFVLGYALGLNVAALFAYWNRLDRARNR